MQVGELNAVYWQTQPDGDMVTHCSHSNFSQFASRQLHVKGHDSQPESTLSVWASLVCSFTCLWVLPMMDCDGEYSSWAWRLQDRRHHLHLGRGSSDC